LRIDSWRARFRAGRDEERSAAETGFGPSQVLLENWNDIGRKLIAMAEDFPEDKYDFKPVPAERSFCRAMLHAANANYFFTNPAMGLKRPRKRSQTRAVQDESCGGGVREKAFADGAAAIKKKGDKG